MPENSYFGLPVAFFFSGRGFFDSFGFGVVGLVVSGLVAFGFGVSGFGVVGLVVSGFGVSGSLGVVGFGVSGSLGVVGLVISSFTGLSFLNSLYPHFPQENRSTCSAM
jgi:hypothetical protein